MEKKTHKQSLKRNLNKIILNHMYIMNAWSTCINVHLYVTAQIYLFQMWCPRKYPYYPSSFTHLPLWKSQFCFIHSLEILLLRPPLATPWNSIGWVWLYVFSGKTCQFSTVKFQSLILVEFLLMFNWDTLVKNNIKHLT